MIIINGAVNQALFWLLQEIKHQWISFSDYVFVYYTRVKIMNTRNVVIIISLGYTWKKANHNYILGAFAPLFLKNFFGLQNLWGSFLLSS